MEYKKIRTRRRRANRNLVFLILSVIFFVTTLILLIRLPGKIGKMNAAREALAQVKETSAKTRQEYEKAQENIADMKNQLEEMKQELQKKEKENPQISKQTDEKEIKHAYLTFDDGPSKNTGKILDFLKANHIKATFFVIGSEGNDELYKRIVDEGHTLAIHSNTHEYSQIYTSVWAFMNDINTLSNKLYNITGVHPKVMRFPGGSNNTISEKYNSTNIMHKLVAKVEEQGYSYFDWNVDSSDASAICNDKDTIVHSVLDGASDKRNAFILMHDASVKTTTVEALPEIVEGLRKEGFVFAKITEDTKPLHFKN